MRQKPHVLGLDGLRGVTAVVVLIDHSLDVLGYRSLLQGAYLTVNLFFCLSGYVLSRAYDDRIGIEITPARFLLLRVIRLYPMLVLGLSIALTLKLIKYYWVGSDVPPLSLAGMMVLGLLFLPAPWAATPFALNGPLWSLSFEMFANMVYAYGHDRLRPLLLSFVLLVGLCALCGLLYSTGLANGGNQWSSLWVGLVRVIVSFFAGVVAFRYQTFIPSAILRLHPLLILTILFAWMAIPSIWIPASVRDLFFIFFIAPTLIAAISATRVPTSLVLPFTWLGNASYPMFAIHYPLALRIADIERHFSGHGLKVVIISAFVIAMIAVGFGLDKWCDRPIRRIILTKLNAQRPASVSVVSGEASPSPDIPIEQGSGKARLARSPFRMLFAFLPVWKSL